MKKALIYTIFVAFLTSPVFATDPFDNFKTQISAGGAAAQTALDSFAKDLGALLGGGTYNDGKSLGFPGFNIGIHVPTKQINNDDTIVKSAGISSVALPIVQVEIGLPANLDLIGRYTSYLNSTLTGYGLRYGIFKPSIPGMPSVSVQAVMTDLNVAANANKFKASNSSVSATVSFNHLPIITPYAGVGYDSTNVNPDATVISNGMTGSASGMRIEAGIDLTLIPFTYIQLGAAVAGGSTNATVGLGVWF